MVRLSGLSGLLIAVWIVFGPHVAITAIPRQAAAP